MGHEDSRLPHADPAGLKEMAKMLHSHQVHLHARCRLVMPRPPQLVDNSDQRSRSRCILETRQGLMWQVRV